MNELLIMFILILFAIIGFIMNILTTNILWLIVPTIIGITFIFRGAYLQSIQ